jgi:hypothetical protein
MDPIDSWVDAAEMRRLAESLVAPAPEMAEAPAITFGQTFVGFEKSSVPPQAAPSRPAVSQKGPAPVKEHARTALAGARQRAERGGILTNPVAAGPPPAQLTAPAPTAPATAAPTATVPQPAPAPARVAAPAPPLRIPAGLFLERLKAYGEWLHNAVSAKAFFVADREGELLIDEVSSPKLLQVARTLAQASWAANRQAGAGPAVGSLHVKLGAGSILEVLPVSTQYGPLILGIIVPGLLPAATVQVVASSLQNAVDGPVQAP